MRSVAKLPQDFADLLIELCEAHAEFLLVGGGAVILYGHVRTTDDMDLFVVRQAVCEQFGGSWAARGRRVQLRGRQFANNELDTFDDCRPRERA